VVVDAGAAFVYFTSDDTANIGSDIGFTFFFVTGVGRGEINFYGYILNNINKKQQQKTRHQMKSQQLVLRVIFI